LVVLNKHLLKHKLMPLTKLQEKLLLNHYKELVSLEQVLQV
jgi:hypothetical protein